MAGTMDSPERAWRVQFNRQLTEELSERVIKQTIALVRKVERQTPWRDQETAEGRLHTAVLKTLDGTRRWDPERVDLERFFLGVIAGDISHEIEHAVKFQQFSLDDDDRNGDALEQETSEAIAESRAVKGEAPKRAWWSKVLAELRTHAADDRSVLAILDAYDHDKFSRREVIEFARLSSRKYREAHQRLMRLAEHVDGDVRELITQAIA